MNRFVVTMCSEKQIDFFAVLYPLEILKLYENSKMTKIVDAKTEQITSALYKCDMLIYTKKKQNLIYIKDINEKSEETACMNIIDGYDEVFVLKYINNIPDIIVLRGIVNNEDKIMLYNFTKKEVICVLPYTGVFYDLYMDSNQTNIIFLCKSERDESLCSDILEVENIYLSHFKIKDDKLIMLDKLSINDEYDSNFEKYEMRTVLTKNMRFPLFDYWEYSWPESKSISSNGKYIVYFCDEIKGLVISCYENGNVYQLFALPKTCTMMDIYYYNEESKILSVLSRAGIKRYIIRENNTRNDVNLLNQMYNEDCEKSPIEKRFEFNRVFFRIIENISVNDENIE